jgi:hypothetical protein
MLVITVNRYNREDKLSKVSFGTKNMKIFRSLTTLITVVIITEFAKYCDFGVPKRSKGKNVTSQYTYNTLISTNDSVFSRQRIGHHIILSNFRSQIVTIAYQSNCLIITKWYLVIH